MRRAGACRSTWELPLGCCGGVWRWAVGVCWLTFGKVGIEEQVCENDSRFSLHSRDDAADKEIEDQRLTTGGPLCRCTT